MTELNNTDKLIRTETDNIEELLNAFNKNDPYSSVSIRHPPHHHHHHYENFILDSLHNINHHHNKHPNIEKKKTPLALDNDHKNHDYNYEHNNQAPTTNPTENILDNCSNVARQKKKFFGKMISSRSRVSKSVNKSRIDD